MAKVGELTTLFAIEGGECMAELTKVSNLFGVAMGSGDFGADKGVVAVVGVVVVAAVTVLCRFVLMLSILGLLEMFLIINPLFTNPSGAVGVEA